MNSIFSLLFFLLISFQPVASLQVGDEPIDAIVSAIDSGSSSDLAKYFDSSISLNINGQQGDYSSNQAELVLKDFFRKFPATSFSLVFKSENNPSLSTYIGEYQTNQTVLKVFIKANLQSDALKIYSLEFVKN